MECRDDGNLSSERFFLRSRNESQNVDLFEMRTIDSHVFSSRLLPRGEWLSVSRRSAEKAAVTRTCRRRYRPADCDGSYKRRCQSQGASRIRDRILRSPSKPVKSYFRSVRILFHGALSAWQEGCYALPRPGKPIVSKIHPALWETESSRSIKINITIHHTAEKILRSVKCFTMWLTPAV